MSDLGFVSWSFSFASKSESEPRLRASSPRAREGTPEPLNIGQERLKALNQVKAHNGGQGCPVISVVRRDIIRLRVKVLLFLKMVNV